MTRLETIEQDKLKGTGFYTPIDIPPPAKPEIPTAVTVKPVLALIKAHLDRDEEAFKIECLKIAHELSLNDKQELSLWILAQYNLVNTFEITD